MDIADAAVGVLEIFFVGLQGVDDVRPAGLELEVFFQVVRAEGGGAVDGDGGDLVTAAFADDELDGDIFVVRAELKRRSTWTSRKPWAV